MGLGLTAPAMLLLAHLVYGALVGAITGVEQYQPVRRNA
jgi:hypothetical protein